MTNDLLPFIGKPLRRVLYYRSGADANMDLNWPGFHDVRQGVEFALNGGHFFVTWDHACEEELTVHVGRMVDFLREGIFEDVSSHPDWQEHIGKPLEVVQIHLSEATVSGVAPA